MDRFLRPHVIGERSARAGIRDSGGASHRSRNCTVVERLDREREQRIDRRHSQPDGGRFDSGIPPLEHLGADRSFRAGPDRAADSVAQGFSSRIVPH